MSGNRIAQDKLKLLYILNSVNVPLTNLEITNFILDNDIFDYFSLQQLLSDLKEAGFVIQNFKNGEEYYSIAQAGIDALDMFGEKLPDYFLKQVENNFTSLKMIIKKNREILGHYYKRTDDEYVVSLQVMENESSIFSLGLNVPDEDTAKLICKKWDSNPEEIFSKIINTLTS